MFSDLKRLPPFEFVEDISAHRFDIVAKVNLPLREEVSVETL